MDYLQAAIQFTFEAAARNIVVKQILSISSASIKAGNHE
jgi:hypothetical protein